MIGSRTSMHTEFSTNFSTSHLTENCSNRFAAKIVGRGEVCDMGCGPGQVARHLPGIALADQESSGSKAPVVRSMCVAILRKRRVFAPGLYSGEPRHVLRNAGGRPRTGRVWQKSRSSEAGQRAFGLCLHMGMHGR